MAREFADSVRDLAEKAQSLSDSQMSEEATKMSLVMPMLNAMGYDVFDASEVCPEYKADTPFLTKHEKVDYAIMENGEPRILIECKPLGDSLDKYTDQLFKYYIVTPAKFGVLTNGAVYRFYTDLDDENKLDTVPFLVVDLFNLSDAAIVELGKFCKPVFNENAIFSRAEELKYSRLIKACLSEEFGNPSDDFVSFVLGKVYPGKKTKLVVDKLGPLVKKNVSAVIDDMVRRKLMDALEKKPDEDVESDAVEPKDDERPKIVTTQEEIEAYFIVRGMLAGHVPVERVTLRDTASYCGVLFDNNNRKPICRFQFDTKQKYIMVCDSVEGKDKGFTRYDVDGIEDLYKYKSELIAIAEHWFNG